MNTMLERIKEAELQADRLVEQANVQARESIVLAKADAEAAVSEAAEAERKATAEAVLKAEAEGEAMQNDIFSHHRETLLKEQKAAETKVPEAVRYLMERVEATV